MINKIMIVLVFGLLTGCSITSPHAKLTKSTPRWYFETPKSDKYIEYGVGEGKDKQLAIKMAYTNLNGKLGVVLDKNYKKEYVYTEIEPKYYKKKVFNEYQEKYELIEMDEESIELVDTFERMGKTLVLVKLDKIMYKNYIDRKVVEEVRLLKEEEEIIQSKDFLDRAFRYKSMLVDGQLLKTYIDIYRNISNNNSNLSREARYLRELIENAEELNKEKIIHVEYIGLTNELENQFNIFLEDNRWTLREDEQYLNVEVQKIGDEVTVIFSQNYKDTYMTILKVSALDTKQKIRNILEKELNLYLK